MITVPTRETLTSTLLAALKASRPNIDTSVGSPEWARINALVELAYGIHWQAREVQYSIWPGPNTPTAELEQHAELALGPNARRGATKAKATDGVQVTGTLAGATVTAGDALAAADGTRFQLTETVVVGVGTANVSLEAITTGEAGNKLTGDELTFESPPANIEADASVVVDLSGGLDQETDAELLERVLYAKRNPPAGGRFSDYWAWAMAVDGVGGAYAYGPSSYALEGRRGLGIVDVAILAAGTTGSARQPSTTLVQDVQDQIDANRPVHSRPGLVLRPTPTSQNIDVTLTPREGFEMDWADAAPGTYTVSSVLAQVITWNTTLPTDLTDLIDAGGTARIFVSGQVLTVTAYAEPAHTTTISETMDPTPSGNIHAAGPCSAGALAAIKAYMDSLGPAKSDGVDTYHDPNQNWDDSCRPSQIFAALVERNLDDGSYTGVQGVREVVVNTPSSTVTPTDIPASNPPFLHYGTITVRGI
jgi:uncharacterized phage protein gp47/JayE